MGIHVKHTVHPPLHPVPWLCPSPCPLHPITTPPSLSWASPPGPGPSADLAWLPLAQSQWESLQFPRLPQDPTPPPPLLQPASPTQGHTMHYHHEWLLLSACHPRLHPHPQHSPSAPTRPPTSIPPTKRVPPPPSRPSDWSTQGCLETLYWFDITGPKAPVRGPGTGHWGPRCSWAASVDPGPPGRWLSSQKCCWAEHCCGSPCPTTWGWCASHRFSGPHCLPAPGPWTSGPEWSLLGRLVQMSSGAGRSGLCAGGALCGSQRRTAQPGRCGSGYQTTSDGPFSSACWLLSLLSPRPCSSLRWEEMRWDKVRWDEIRWDESVSSNLSRQLLLSDLSTPYPRNHGLAPHWSGRMLCDT